MKIPIDLDIADRDAILLALAWLSLHRPSWLPYLREVAAKCGRPEEQRAVEHAFDDFRRFNEDRSWPGTCPETLVWRSDGRGLVDTNVMRFRLPTGEGELADAIVEAHNGVLSGLFGAGAVPTK